MQERGSSMTNGSAASAFIPGTVASVERGVSALVSRFAAPVRALGARTLSFVDRIIGSHLAPVEQAAPGPRAARGAGHLLMPVPWYQLDEAPMARHAAPL